MAAAALEPGSPAPLFSLPEPSGHVVALADTWGKDATVVLFTSNHCPYSQAWEDRLIDLARTYQSRGVSFVAVNSNATQRQRGEGPQDIAARAAEKRYPYPYVMDDDQSAARDYGASRTPELFIFDAEHRLGYHGAPDDNYDDPDQVRQRYAALALDAILAGRRPDPSTTTPLGCPLRFVAKGPTERAPVVQPRPVQTSSSVLTMVSSSPLIYYSLRDCPTCVKAKAALQERGIPFVEREVDDDDLWQQEVFRLSGQTTVPVFVRDGKVEIGFEGEPGCHF